jgi:hypothetical protein
MLGRALSLAAVTLLIGCLTAGVVRGENLDAGKSPSQIFSSTCSACHKSPRGLLKNTSTSSLPGFLRQHYTTGTDMASVLSSYLISNGAADPRYQSKDQAKKDARQKDARPDARPDQPERLGRRQLPAAPAQEASRPCADGATPQNEGARPDRASKRYSRRHTAPEAGPDGQAPVQAATDSKSGGRQKSRRGRPAVEEPPKAEQATRGGDAAKEDVSRDAARPDSSKPDLNKSDSAKPESAPSEPDKAQTVTTDPVRTDAIKDTGDKPAGETTKPAGESSREGRSDTAKVDGARETGGSSDPTPPRPDLVLPATTAPESPAAASPPVAATAPASPPAATSGPPTPPISR